MFYPLQVTWVSSASLLEQTTVKFIGQCQERIENPIHIETYKSVSENKLRRPPIGLIERHSDHRSNGTGGIPQIQEG